MSAVPQPRNVFLFVGNGKNKLSYIQMLVMQLEIFETKHALCYVMLFIDDDGIVKWRFPFYFELRKD